MFGRKWFAIVAFSTNFYYLARRTKVASEILESEKTYVGRLEVIVKVFIDPLRVRKINDTRNKEKGNFIMDY